MPAADDVVECEIRIATRDLPISLAKPTQTGLGTVGVGNDVSLFPRAELLEVFHQHDSGFTWHKAGEEN
jgi:hypothetical protein